MKVLGKDWFTEMGAMAPIGIVLVKLTPIEMQEFDAHVEMVAFIGTALDGNTEKQDIDRIIRGGARFPVKAAEALMGLI